MCNPIGLIKKNYVNLNTDGVVEKPLDDVSVESKTVFTYLLDPLDSYTYIEILSFDAWLHKVQLEDYRKYISSYRNTVQQEIREAATKLAKNATDQNSLCLIEALTNIDDALADLQNKAIWMPIKPKLFDIPDYTVTGKMDRSISEMIMLAQSTSDDVTKQTLKHHAEDMILAGKAILKIIGAKGLDPVNAEVE